MVRSTYLIFIIILWLYTFCCATSNLIINHRSATLELLCFLFFLFSSAMSNARRWAMLWLFVLMRHIVDANLIELIYLTSLSSKLWQGAQLCVVCKGDSPITTYTIWYETALFWLPIQLLISNIKWYSHWTIEYIVQSWQLYRQWYRQVLSMNWTQKRSGDTLQTKFMTTQSTTKTHRISCKQNNRMNKKLSFFRYEMKNKIFILQKEEEKTNKHDWVLERAKES